MKRDTFSILTIILMVIPLFFFFARSQGKGVNENSPIRIQAPGDLIWSYTVGNHIYGCPAIDPSGNIYFGSYDGNLYALNSDGSLRWSFAATGLHLIDTSPTIDSSGNIYFGTATLDGPNNAFYALNSDGSLRWSFGLGTVRTWSSPAIDSDGNIYFGADSGNLYAFNSDGSLRWSNDYGGAIRSSPSIDLDGTIYIAENDRVLALNSDGSIKWSYTVYDKIESSLAIDSSGSIYFGVDAPSATGEFFALNSAGGLLWTFDVGDDIEEGPAIDSSGNLYFGTQDFNVYALNSDGTLRWSYYVGDDIEFCSPAIGDDGTVYIGSSNDNLYALNSDGTLQWSYDAGGNLGHVAIGSDGTIYVGSNTSDTLHALESSSTGLMDSAWPKFGHDMRNTKNRANPTLIELAYFRGKYIPYRSKIIIEWKTETELETYGFYLLRKEEEKGTYFPMNSYVILAQGDSMTGAEYSYDDYNVKEEKTYYYLLEEIDLHGVSHYYGPISVSTRDFPLIDKERVSENKKNKK